ncbi:uncharacterized protein LOC126278406 [Schistocerca gregaria]|uniref:uncharacterized protein LOC126278406 n=1 Tax=Schistocerca gregaria TaxID=7010 RepID=UPI00211F2E47|nr:uncharacterized protein LOC126278406 [Schistocerca gregaria]
MPTVSNALIILFNSMRHGENAELRRQRSKLNIVAGKSLCTEDLVDDPDSSSSEDNDPDIHLLNTAEYNVDRMAGDTAEGLGNSRMTQQSVKTNDFVIVRC